jgi:hypothetical protein
MNRPSLVPRSKFSVSDTTVMPRSRSSLTVVSTCPAEQPHRSDFQNFSVSPASGSAKRVRRSGRNHQPQSSAEQPGAPGR